MLTLISGPFHPHLENAFISRVKSLKTDPWSPVAVIAPSGRIQERLQLILSKNNTSVLNLFFYTFSSMAREIVDSDGDLSKPILSDPLFFDTLVKFIQKEDRPFHGFEDMALPEGFPAAVRETLRDLVDAGVPPDVQDAIGEGFLGETVDLGTLKELFKLYRIYLNRVARLKFLPRIALTREAIKLAPASKRLAQFKEIIFYGFYDLTGVQLDFLQALAMHHKAALFYPFVADHPAYKFSGFFKDNFLQRMIEKETSLPAAPLHEEAPAKIFNVSGLRDEAWVVAREILRLHEEEKIPFEEIAVVSRNKERLRSEIPISFGERNIPYHAVEGLPLIQVPAVVEFLDLLKEALASSPEFAKTGWEACIQKALKELDSFQPLQSVIAAPVLSLLQEAVESLSIFSDLKPAISAEEFVEIFRERCAETSLQTPKGTEPYVSLLYAEQARGLSFKVVFLLGVEERVFPRIIREDPFLRDNARLALTNTLGYKIPQKMGALDEERLLFHIITQSADERLYLTYQRSDENGSIVGPSAFLRAFVEERRKRFEEAVTLIPRPYFSKLHETAPEFMSRRDAIILALSSDREKGLDLAGQLDPQRKGLEEGLKTLSALQAFKDPGVYDGIIDSKGIEDWLKDFTLSPTRLEVFGRCPFQFMAETIWGLERPDEDWDFERMDPRLKGEWVHRFFQEYFISLTENGQKPAPYEFEEKAAQRVFDGIFPLQAPSEVKMHPVLWEALRIQVWRQIKRCLIEDIEGLNSNRFTPTFFEKKIVATLAPPLDQMNWQGVMDRIDIGSNKARVVDYKTGWPGKVSVPTGALQGFQSQPPVYLLLLEKFLREQKIKAGQTSFSYCYLREEEPFKELSAEAWEENKVEILRTIQIQLGLLTQGQFPMLPGNYCSWCWVAQMCRKNDSISSYRSESGPAEKMNDCREKKA